MGSVAEDRSAHGSHGHYLLLRTMSRLPLPVLLFRLDSSQRCQRESFCSTHWLACNGAPSSPNLLLSRCRVATATIVHDTNPTVSYSARASAFRRINAHLPGRLRMAVATAAANGCG